MIVATDLREVQSLVPFPLESMSALSSQSGESESYSHQRREAVRETAMALLRGKYEGGDQGQIGGMQKTTRDVVSQKPSPASTLSSTVVDERSWWRRSS